MQIETLLAAVLSIALVTQTSAQERKLKRAELPPAVQRTADEQSKGAKVIGYSRERDEGQLVYEVSMTIRGHNRDVTIDSAGTVLEVEETVPLRSLPDAVRAGLRQLADSGQIVIVESLTRGGRLVGYEAQVRHGAKRSEIQVGPDGKPANH